MKLFVFFFYPKYIDDHGSDKHMGLGKNEMDQKKL